VGHSPLFLNALKAEGKPGRRPGCAASGKGEWGKLAWP